MPLGTGFVLHSRYRIVKLLGQGGFGAVYRAWDTSLERPCAIKENLGTTDEAQRQFKREATILANVVHPNLPRVTDHFIIPGQGQYLVMDYVEGEDLQSMLERTGAPLPSQQVLSWIGQVCDALSHLHSQNPPIIHRDIKPANIRITTRGQAMLVDFGIAKIFDPHMKTTSGARAVTPGFSPPEQYGQGTTDARSDVYALGATLYALLTGQTPPDSVNLISGGAAPPLTHELNRQIPINVSHAIARAMQVNRTGRFENAKEFKAALQGIPPGARQFVAPARTAASVAPEAIPIAPTVQVSIPSPTSAIPSDQAPAYSQSGKRRIPCGLIIGILLGVVALSALCLTAIALIPGIFPSPTNAPKIANAFMALDEYGEDPSTVFEPDDDIYVIVKVTGAPEDTMLKSIWIAKDVRSTESGAIIHEYEMSVTDGIYWMSGASSNDSWQGGSYTVELYLNDEQQQTLVFEVHSDEPWLENLFTCFDKEGTQPTTIFGPNDVFYVVGDLVNAPEEVSLKTVWTAIDAENTEPYEFLGDHEISLDEGGFWFSLSPKKDKSWPIGKYQVELFIDGELIQTLEFEIQ